MASLVFSWNNVWKLSHEDSLCVSDAFVTPLHGVALTFYSETAQQLWFNPAFLLKCMQHKALAWSFYFGLTNSALSWFWSYLLFVPFGGFSSTPPHSTTVCLKALYLDRSSSPFIRPPWSDHPLLQSELLLIYWWHTALNCPSRPPHSHLSVAWN